MSPLLQLAGPLANPFRIFHKKRSPKTVLGTRHNAHLTWERKELPDAGAGNYAWETYGLPPFPRFGNGNINVTNPLRETTPALYVFQATPVVGLPPRGMLQGQFVTQPLLDPSTAQNMGIVQAGAIPGSAPNAIANSQLALAP